MTNFTTYVLAIVVVYTSTLAVAAWIFYKYTMRTAVEVVKEGAEEFPSRETLTTYVKKAFQKGVDTERKNAEQAYAEGIKAGFELAQEVKESE